MHLEPFFILVAVDSECYGNVCLSRGHCTIVYL